MTEKNRDDHRRSFLSSVFILTVRLRTKPTGLTTKKSAPKAQRSKEKAIASEGDEASTATCDDA